MVSQVNSYLPPRHSKHLIRDSGDPWFMFYVYGFDLLDKIWLVSIVVDLVVACLLGCVVSTLFILNHKSES